MSTSLYPTVLDALVTGLTAAVAGGVEVKAGKPVNNENTSLWVGGDLDDSSVNSKQRWAGLGHAARDETIEIPCMYWLFTGDDDYQAAVHALYDVQLAAVENYLRQNPNLGIATNSIRAQYGDGQSLLVLRTGQGLELQLKFTINIEGRI